MRIFAVLLALAACAPAGVSTSSPAAAWRDFSRAYARADLDAAWSLLSKESQAELTRAAREVAAAERKNPPADGRRFAFLNGTPFPRAVRKLEVVEEQESRALVEVVDDAGARRVVLVVKEGAGWRVDLSDALRNAYKSP